MEHPSQIQVARRLSPIHFFTRPAIRPGLQRDASRWSAERPRPAITLMGRNAIALFRLSWKDKRKMGNATERHELSSRAEQGITLGLKTIEKISSANLWPIFDGDHKLQSRPDIRHRAHFYVHQAGIKPTLPNRVPVDVSRNARAFLRPRNPEHACGCQ